MSYTKWFPRDVELMTTAWRYGNTMDEIANDLFQGRFTRAAVAGKLFRLGLKRGIRKTRVRFYPETRKARPPIPRKPKPSLRPNSLNMPLYLLSPHGCRWPVAEDTAGEHLMCGVESVRGKPYCAYHAGRAIGRVLKAA